MKQTLNPIFRFDDICGNTDMAKVNKMADIVRLSIPGVRIWYCVSPLYHDLNRSFIHHVHPVKSPVGRNKEMVFPGILVAHSDHRLFYKVDKCVIPPMPDSAIPVSHGLFHVDHRLLGREAQEMSIMGAASLVKSDIFVPPFNKWNTDTDAVCNEHNIRLIKFEDGWLHMLHNDFDPLHPYYYTHGQDYSIDDFARWFRKLGL